MAKNTVIVPARMSTGKVSLTVRYAELAPAEAVNKISYGWSHTVRRQGHGCVGAGGLGFAVVVLAAAALELPAHVDLGAAEVDQVPGEAERFAPAQAEDGHQHVRGVERVAVSYLP